MEGFEHIKLIGSGFFCNVQLYKDTSTNTNIAVKELKKKHYSNDEYRYRLLREIDLLKQLHPHNNIISLLAFNNDPSEEKLWYAMPFATTNLHEYIMRNNAVLTINDRIFIIDQVLEAIRYAHSKNIIHRDISPNNVLIFLSDGVPQVKVSDFGLGKNTDSLSHYTRLSVNGYGQDLYVAPEQREHLANSTNKSDLYALGKLVYFIITGKEPRVISTCVFSTLIQKATEENPDKRHQDIEEFIGVYNLIKSLIVETEINLDNITAAEYVKSKPTIDWLELHHIAIKVKYYRHVFDDYLFPLTEIFKHKNNVEQYYSVIGNSALEFVNAYIDAINQCVKTVGWPFDYTPNFGDVLLNIYNRVTNEDIKLTCLKQLWRLGVELDRWRVKSSVMSLIQEGNIPEAILFPFAAYILESGHKVRIDPQFLGKVQEPIRRALWKME